MGEATVKYHTGPPPRTACEACGQITTQETDHCHAHGWVRGVLCRSCNALMILIDRRTAPKVDAVLAAALVAIRNRCPDCDPLDVRELAARVPAKNVTALLEDTQFERLRRAAFETRLAMADILREALGQWLDDRETGPTATT